MSDLVTKVIKSKIKFRDNRRFSIMDTVMDMKKIPLPTQVVNAIHGVFKNAYFFSIYTNENLSSLSIIMFGTSDLMA